MAGKYIEFDKEEVVQLYNELKSAEKVAQEINHSPNAVLNFLKREDEYKNFRGKTRERNDFKSLNLNEQEVIEAYHEEKIIARVADRFGCSGPTIRKILDANDVKRYPIIRNDEPYNKIYLDESEVINIYRKEKSLRKTAKLFNCSLPTISRILEENGVERTNDKIITQKMREKASQTFKKLHEQGLFSGENHSQWKGGKKTVYCKYCGKEQQRWDGQINDIVVCKECLTDFHKEYTPKGEESPLWKGGISPEKILIRRCLAYRVWHKNILKRDNFKCTNCGTNKNLCVHHIVPFAQILEEEGINSIKDILEDSQLWDVDNGITLCHECHMEAHRCQE